jgi:hypothetical protein
MGTLRQNRNITYVVLSDVTKLTSALPSVGTVVTSSNLEQGAVVMVDLGMRRTVLSSLADGDGFMIVQGKGANRPLVKSPAIYKGTTKITGTKHKPARQQITTIGYNGTTGSLPVANDTSFFIKIRKNDNDAANRSQPLAIYAQYKTDASGTQQELAFGLANNGVINTALEPANGYVKFEVISDGTAAVVSDGTQTQDAIVTNGSTVITLVDTGTTTAGNTAGIASAIPVGSTIYIAGATYVVTALNANAVTLNMPYQGTTGTVTGGTTYATQFGEVTSVTNYGIRLTGIQADFDVNAFRNYFANRFTATFSDSSTLVTHVQGAYNGNGVWQQVAMDEYMMYGFLGQNEMMATPPRLRDQEVKIPGENSQTALTSKYSPVSIEWQEVTPGELVSVIPSRGSVLIYFNLADSSGSGILDTGTANTGETLAAALGLTPSSLDE